MAGDLSIIIEMEERPCRILAIENDPDEAFILSKAFARASLRTSLHLCRNIGEARAYLAGAGIYADRATFPMPNVILSDLNMPAENGLDLLIWLKSQPGLRSIPVIILSGTANPAEVSRAAELGAIKTVTKSPDLAGLTSFLEQMVTEFCRES